MMHVTPDNRCVADNPRTRRCQPFCPLGRLNRGSRLLVYVVFSAIGLGLDVAVGNASAYSTSTDLIANAGLIANVGSGELPIVIPAPVNIPVDMMFDAEGNIPATSASDTRSHTTSPLSCPSGSLARPSSGGCVSQQYQLSRGDRIQIDVFDAPEYSGEYELFTDGTVSLPLAGQFDLQGLTLAEAETLISVRLARILRRPFVTIRLLEERPLNLAVTGQVNRPGAYTISLDEVNGIPTVTKAIQLANGIRLTADIRNIQVLRMNPRTAQVDEVAIINLWALLEYGDLSQDIALQDGDSIVIPQVDTVNYDEINLLAYANLSPEEMTVNVVGEVQAPGAIQVKPNTPLHQALLAAGGFTNRAKKKEVLLVRLNPDGTVTNQEIEVDFSQPISDFGNPPLMPFDTVVVGRSNFAKVTDVLDQALGSIARIVGVLAIFGL